MVYLAMPDARDAWQSDSADCESAAAPSGRPSAPIELGEARWRITSEISAQLPLKLLGYVARLDLVARHVSIASTADMLDIVILTDGISERDALIIADNMRAVVGVNSAELLWRLR